MHRTKAFLIYLSGQNWFQPYNLLHKVNVPHAAAMFKGFSADDCVVEDKWVFCQQLLQIINVSCLRSLKQPFISL
jgi:hypothetical protein